MQEGPPFSVSFQILWSGFAGGICPAIIVASITGWFTIEIAIHVTITAVHFEMNLIKPNARDLGVIEIGSAPITVAGVTIPREAFEFALGLMAFSATQRFMVTIQRPCGVSEGRDFFCSMAPFATPLSMALVAHIMECIGIPMEFKAGFALVMAVATAFSLVAFRTGKAVQFDMVLMEEGNFRSFIEFL